MANQSGREQLRSTISALSNNGGVAFELGTVQSASPLRIKIDNMAVTLDTEDLVVCEHLTRHTRTATINGGTTLTIVYDAALSANDRVIVASTNGGQLYIVIDRIGGV